MRSRVLIVLCALIVATAALGSGTASAGSGDPYGFNGTSPVSLRLHKRWIQWAFGSSSAPLLQEDFCGEQIGGNFYLTVAGGSNSSITRHIECDIPAGVPILATPGGSIFWAPTFGTTDQKLRKATLAEQELLLVRSVHLKLDGVEIDHGPTVMPDPYDLSLEPGNLLETVDPNVTGDSTRIAEAWYFTLFRPLDTGTYTLLATDKFDYPTGVARFRTVFTLHVG